MLRKKIKKILSLTVALTLAVSGGAVTGSANLVKAEGSDLSGKTIVTEQQLTESLGAYEDANLSNVKNRASVHDPSVIKNETNASGEYAYYVFGSHMAVAGSNDLVNWINVNSRENDSTSPLFGVVKNGVVEKASFQDAFKENAYQGTVTTLSGKTVDFGSFDAEAFQNGNVDGNMWAPDVIYNTAMKKYCMYLSLNGADNTQESVIIMLSADDIEGPYVYEGPVVYTRVSDVQGSSTYWKNTDMKFIYEDAESMPARYANTGAGNYADYFPHAIDPSVFYDQAGNLWMVYGSWSGGIFMLELDEATGLRDYTVSYVDANLNNGVTDLTTTKETFGKDYTADPYFGKKVAGGYYVSGEGPYIEYMNGYYYLFLSYGEYAPDGNYQMRVFKSQNPNGPYVDSKGISAIYNQFEVNFNAGYGDVYGGTDLNAPGTTRGDRLMTNYKWDTMATGETSEGHNSAITIDGKSYVIFHTKFDDGSLSHEVRVHELFTTVDGCVVAAPYEYDAKVTDKTSYAASEVTGTYDVIFDRYSTHLRYDGSTKETVSTELCETPVQMKLVSDGTVTENGTVVGYWSLDSNKNATIRINAGYADEHLAGTYHGVFVEQNANGVQATCFTVMNPNTGIGLWGSKSQENDIYAIALTNQKVSVPAETTESISLPTEGLSGAVISWSSSDTSVMTNGGTVRGVMEPALITLTETIISGEYAYTKEWQVNVQPQSADSVSLTSNDFMKVVENPFYGKELENLFIRYTINWKEDAPKNGWDGLFSFYNTATTGRVSVQSAPYLCYNDMNGNWLDMNQPYDGSGTNKAAVAEKGRDYTYEITLTSGGAIKMSENGVEFTPEQKGEGDYSVSNILSLISGCDQFTWGVGIGKTSFWNSEICTLKDIVISDEIPQTEELTDSYQVGSEIAKIEKENPFYGKEVHNFIVEYTAQYPEDTALDIYGGLLAFYPSATAGRISFHPIPYLCYNEAQNEVWVDIKSANEYKELNTAYHFTFVTSEQGTDVYVNGEKIETNVTSGVNGSSANLLKYVAACDKYSIGTGKERSYWGSVASAQLSNIRFAINESNMVEIPPVEVAQKYIVSYDLQGHGKAIAESLVKAGAVLTKPADPTATGYLFKGWYKDAAGTQAWDFANDTVNEDMVLYAVWAEKPAASTSTDYEMPILTDDTQTGTTTQTPAASTDTTPAASDDTTVTNAVIKDAAESEDGIFTNASGEVLKNSIVETADGTKYITDEEGKKRTNEIVSTDDGTKYAVQKDGAVAVDKVVTINGKKYMATEDGSIATSTFSTTAKGNKVYSKANGVIATSQLFTVNGKRYYATASGAIAISKLVKTADGSKVYAGKSGAIVKSRTIKVGDARYYAGKTGKIVTNKWVTVNGKKYYCSASGKITKVKK